MRRSLPTLLLLVSGLGCAPELPAAPAHPTPSAFVAAERAPLPGLTSDPPAPFTLQPGDQLTLRTLSVRPLEAEVSVDPAGRLHVPLAGAVEVGGLPLDAAERRIEGRLAPYDRFARVSLHVREARGHLASVAGAVREPGRYVVEGDLRVSDLLARAGGPRALESDEVEWVELADLAGASLVRDGEALPIDVSLAARGRPHHDVRVHAGDLLYVPPARGRHVTVLGEVGEPRVLPFSEGLRLTAALARAGGMTDDADEADVRVLRGPLSGPAVYRANLSALVRGEAPDVALAPGDVVYVTTEWLAEVGEVIQRLAPALGGAALLGLAR
ncbi:MAG TPA: SLBB domain-containing protein [Polyangiaceae bacterium LLY-WYZ-15_(1-7)]|nr:SLBB domain-containing protein [Polyangiaceae bacterium LLY-WYZ-15_(1-7)]HJL07567.1 SLBB domain-containing protein [Polyangiaceae bacterium LLY-WYZ-15_(1-7)]HJL38374.1 SLBB domain-containing protein [Polyangiaceae bacterium LLY-WYZ-15_(1-7)]